MQKIDAKFHPVSIFLYGSRARGDYTAKSDFEIGVLFRNNKYIHRSTIQKHCPSGFNVFPFRINEFKTASSDVPFVEKLFFKELFLSAKTLKGREIKDLMIDPSITLIDLIEDVRFYLGRGISAITTFRDYDKNISVHLFYKSCLFSARSLEIYLLKKFPITYKDIYQFSNPLSINQKFKNLIANAYRIRLGATLKEKDLYMNLKFLNFIQKKFKAEFNKHGNIKLL